MDDEEFRRKLSEVAEWQIPMVGTATSRLIIKYETDNNDDLDMDENEDDEEFASSGDTNAGFIPARGNQNNSIPPVITKLKIAGTTCEDCGDYCANGRQKEKKLYQAEPKHWREKCLTCGHWRHPVTGKFTLTGYDVAGTYTYYLSKLRAEKTACDK